MADPTTPPPSPRTPPAVVILTAIALAGILVFHGAATVLYVAPFNPLRLAVGQQLNAYMLPLFEQNWSLFAPQPISEDRGLLVRARVAGDDGRRVVTDYVDITSPAVDAIHDNRLFAARHARLSTNALQMLTHTDPLLAELRELAEQRTDTDAEGDEGGPSTTPPDAPTIAGSGSAPDAAARERGELLMATLASAEAVKRWGNRVEAVQVRVVMHEYPRYSQRHDDGLGTITYSDLEWMPRQEVTW